MSEDKKGKEFLDIPTVTYPGEYIKELEKDCAETEEKLQSGELAVFDTAGELIDYLSRE